MLDKSKPYSEICGIVEEYPGARWYQAGRYYRKNGEFIGPGTEHDSTPEPEPDDFPERLEIDCPRKWEIIPVYEGLSLKQAKKLHWTRLKQIMKKHGVEFTTRAEAVKWIES